MIRRSKFNFSLKYKKKFLCNSKITIELFSIHLFPLYEYKKCIKELDLALFLLLTMNIKEWNRNGIHKNKQISIVSILDFLNIILTNSIASIYSLVFTITSFYIHLFLHSVVFTFHCFNVQLFLRSVVIPFSCLYI